jgi:hypothetical protein
MPPGPFTSMLIIRVESLLSSSSSSPVSPPKTGKKTKTKNLNEYQNVSKFQRVRKRPFQICLVDGATITGGGGNPI